MLKQSSATQFILVKIVLSLTPIVLEGRRFACVAIKIVMVVVVVSRCVCVFSLTL